MTMATSERSHFRQELDARVLHHSEKATSHNEFAQAFGTLRRRWKLVLFYTFLAVLSAVGYLTVAPARYAASTLILIEPQRQLPQSQTSSSSDRTFDSSYIDSQVEIVKSDFMIRSVVQSSGLVDDPILEPSRISQLFSEFIAKAKFWKVAPPPLTNEQKLKSATDALEKMISAKRLGLTQIIEITAEMPDSRKAAEIANAFAETYIREQLNRNERIARQSAEALRERSKALQSQALAAEVAFERSKARALSDTDAAQGRIALREMESIARSLRLLHDRFLERSLEVSQQQFFSVSGAQVISTAQAPLKKSAPSARIILLGSVLVGLGVGSALAFLKEAFQARP